MMTLDKLKSFFPPDRHRDVDDLYARFRQRHDPAGDIPRFVRYLNQKGVLSGRTLRDVLTLGDVHVATLDTQALSQRGMRRPATSGSGSGSGSSAKTNLGKGDGGRYLRVGLLGKGAMGEVHVATDGDLNRTVAVKRIHPQLASRDIISRRFYTEAQITAQLDHPNIVPVYSFERDATGALEYAMKLVRGDTLEAFLAETRGQLEAGGAVDDAHILSARLELFFSVCAAVAYAHSRGVIHRDLKPENIMVGAYDEVLVMDWGIARVIGGGSGGSEDAREETADLAMLDDGEGLGDSHHATQAGAIVGTPQYMSPEQAQGLIEQLGPASDQYALGLILHEIICLSPAIGASGQVLETVIRAASGDTAPLKAHPAASGIPPELAAIVARATQVVPEQRYASVEALAADVRRFLNNEAVHARPDGAFQKLGRWVSHNRTKALSIMFALILAGAGTGLLLFMQGQAAVQAQREAAERREDRLLALAVTVGGRARQVDAEFDRYQELLTGMAFAAEVALAEPARADAPVWRCDQFASAGGAPPDAAPSSIFDKRVSVNELCAELAPGVDADAIAPRLRQLGRLSRTFFRAKLESYSPDALDLPRRKQEALIRDEGVPAAFAYMGLEEGVLATYPGRDTRRTGYDPRVRPWYKPATQRRGPVWIATDSLSDLKGLLLTCAMAVRSKDDALLGVVAIDLSFAGIINRFLEQPDIDAPPESIETWFLTGKGEVLMQSSLREIALTANDHKAEPFAYPELLPRFAEDSSGITHAGPESAREVVLWSRISTTGWTYVVTGSSAVLLGD